MFPYWAGQLLTELEPNYMTSRKNARQSRQFICSIWNVHSPLDITSN